MGPNPIVGADMQSNFPLQTTGTASVTTTVSGIGVFVATPAATVNVSNVFASGPAGNELKSIENSVLQAIPEPGTYALFGCGLLGLVALRRRLAK